MPVGGPEKEGPLANLLGMDLVRQVDDVPPNPACTEHSLHRADIRVGRSKIGQEDNGRMFATARHRHFPRQAIGTAFPRFADL